MEDEKQVTNQLDGGFVKTKEMVTKIVNSMETMLVEESTSICFYVVVFTCIMIVLLVWFG